MIVPASAMMPSAPRVVLSPRISVSEPAAAFSQAGLNASQASSFAPTLSAS